jgi:hypothetical protein
MDNAVLIHQMTVHHEGFEVYFGPDAENLVLTPISTGGAGIGGGGGGFRVA